MPEHPTPLIPSAAHEIVNRRVLAASRERVFAAFADPAALARWWGPKGFTNAFHVWDFRPGGRWLFTMRGPDGASYAMDHRFVEIVPSTRVVIRHLQPGHDFTLAISFSEADGGTAVTWSLRFDDPAEAARLRDFLLQANEENLDRLAADVSTVP